MDSKDGEGPDSSWSYIDIASMLNGNLDRYQDSSYQDHLPVHQSGGDHPSEGECVIDPDYFDILGMQDPSELIKRKTDISR